MKKHPFIRPLRYDKLSTTVENSTNTELIYLDHMTNSEIRNIGRNNIIISVSEDRTYTANFIFNNSGNAINIPIPDMSLVYLRLAYTNFKESFLAKSVLLKKKKSEVISLEDTYRFVGSATIGIVNLYNSIESYCNQMIPQTINIPRKDKNGYKELNYDDVKMLSISEKIKIILPHSFGKSFIKYNVDAYNYILDKIDLRNKIVHLTYEGKIDDQVDLIQNLLITDYTKLYNSTTSLFNHYKNNFVIECTCLNDF